ncbi:MAG: GAF domain-containing protein [Bacteroidetes bacterium]|jgi:PAS domain S-box-containing protein|nr:GAF domain-containing protein [Bacteroidota bacterium]
MIYDDIRLQAVERFKTLDIDTDKEFREFVDMASTICSTPIALITLLETDIQWLKVKKGTDVEQMPVKTSFCTHTILQDDVMVVPDAQKDERFADSPIVAGAPNVRFYAGTPLITSEGQRIGTLCVIDMEPHELNRDQQQMLKMLGKQAIGLMDFRISVEMLEKNRIEVEQHKNALKKAEIRLRSFFESSKNFHVLLGKNGEVIDYNKVAFLFLKTLHNAKITRGSQFVNFLKPELIDRFNESFSLALKGEKVFIEGVTDYEHHGKMYWEASFETARDARSKIIGISYVIRDVTDRKIKELKIIDQNRSLLKIAHVQAHEFRAPLTSIIGMMDLIAADDYKAPKEYLEMLGKAVHTLDTKICEIVGTVDSMELLNGTEVYSA